MRSARSRVLVIALAAVFALLAESAFATHFRYGYLFWERDLTYVNPANPNEVKIDVTFEAGGRWTYTAWNAATAQGITAPVCPTPSNPSACCAGVVSNYASSTFTSLSCPPTGGLVNFAGGVVAGVAFIGTGPLKIIKRHGVTLASPITYNTLTVTNIDATPPGATADLPMDVIVTQVIPVQDVFYGRATFSMLMDKRFPLTMLWTNSNRISELKDGNGDYPWKLRTTIDLTGANANLTKSPKTTSFPVATVFTGQNNIIDIPSQSFDNQVNTFRLATTQESGLPVPTPAAPSAFSIDPNTGRINFTPRADGFYAVQVIVQSKDPNTGVLGASVPLDFMFQAVPSSGTTTTTVATADGQTGYTATVGQQLSFTVRGTMNPVNAGYTTTINHGVLPAGAFTTGGTCTGAQVCSQTFSWTPTVNSSSSVLCFSSTVTNGQVLIAQSPQLCVSLDIAALATTLVAEPASGAAGGGPLVLKATLKRSIDNAPLPGRTINFTFPGSPTPPWIGTSSAVTDVNGVATATVTSVGLVQPAAPYQATFSAIAGELLESSSATNMLSVKAATTSMNVPTFAVTPTIGYPLAASALLNRIYTDGGTLAVGANVQFTLSSPGGSVELVSADTGANGVATPLFSTPLQGGVSYTLQASFAGNAALFPNADGTPTTATTAPFTAKRRTQIGIQSDTNANVGIATPVTVSLLELPNLTAPLANRSVQISGAFTNSPMTAVTDASGRANFNVTFTSVANAVVTASYTPNGTETNRNGLLTTETAAQTVAVVLAPTQLVLTAPQNATVNQPMSASAQLSRTNTAGSVSGVTVTFTMRNSSNAVLGTRTGVTDANGVATMSPPITPPTAGVYTLVATSPATTALSAATSSTATITASTIPAANLTVSPVSTFSGVSTSFSATLTSNGLPIVGKNVDFSIVGGAALGTGTTNAAGVAMVTAVAGAPMSGSYLATFTSDGSFTSATQTAAYTVSATSTQLTLGSLPTSAFVNGPALTVSATLNRTSPPAGAISGASVTFTVTAPNGSITTPTAITVADGSATISVTPTMRGVYTVAASYAGGGGINPSSTAAAGVTVYQKSVLSLATPTGVAGSNVMISATLRTDVTAQAIPGQVVTFTVNGTQQSVTTDVNGQAAIAAVFPNAGTVQVDAAFHNVAGFFADHNGQLAAETGSTTATISPALTSLTAVTVPATGTVGSIVTASTTLTRQSAPAGVLAGQLVSFTLTNPAGIAVTLSATTDAGGLATVSFPALTTRGAHSIVATFAGTGGLAASTTATATITVSQNLQITLTSPASGFAGASIQFTATVNSLPDGTPVNDPLIVIFTAGSQTAQAMLSGGVATGSITFPNAGSRTVTASVAAGNGYLAATSDPAPLNINPATVALGSLNLNATSFVGDTATIAATLTRTSAPVGPVSGEIISFTVSADSGNPPQQTITAVTDFNGMAQINLPLTVRGAYHVSASFAGSSSLATAARSADFAVFQKTAIVVNAANGVASDPTSVFAALITVPGNQPVSGQTLNFDFLGVTPQGMATTDLAGVASVSRAFAAAGTYPVTASFQNLADFFVDQNGSQVPTTAEGTVNIQAITTALSTMTVPAFVLVGEDLTVTTTLSRVTAPSSVLAGRVITFTMSGGSTQTATTDANGVASATFHIAARGGFTVSASYGGGVADVAAATSVNGGARQVTQITLAQPASTAGVPMDVTATLIATPGGPLSGQTISFSAPGAVPSTGSATTDAFGVAHFTATYSVGGSFPVTASFAAEQGDFTNHDGVVAAETISTSAVVNKAAAQLSAVVAPAHAVVGQALTLVTTLTRETAPASPWPGSVTFTITLPDGSTQMIPSTALADGVASATFTPSVRGAFSATASFDGDSSLNAATSSAAAITVYQRTTLTVAPATAASHTPVTISATLAQLPGGAPLSGQEVAFSFTDGSWASATTDPAGVARVTQTFNTVGDYTATATFTNAAGFYADSTGAFPLVSTTADGTVHITNNAPTFTAPSNITAEATAANGAVATFTAAGNDIEDGSIDAVCSSASGSIFPLGSTTVTCTVTDSLGAHVSDSFTVTVEDTTAPVLTLPAVAPVPATAASGAAVNFTVTAADAVDAVPTVVCTAASGSNFAIGTTPVSCTTTDAHGNTSSGTFNVTVFNNAPTIVDLPDISASATSAAGRVVSFTSTGNDTEDGAITPVCTPVSGSTFPIGTTSVTCTVTDVAGASASDSFTVTITNNAPTFTAPASISLAATSAAGRAVSFTATGSDVEDGTLHADCEARSGNTFPIGTTNIACTVTDVAGATASGSFSITITNNAPTFTTSANKTAEATGPAGAAVSYTVSGSDIEDGGITPVCSAASGSIFGLGTTTVSCTVTDSRGATATGSFTVTVQDTTKPTLTLPANIAVDPTSAAGAAVTYTATASDIVTVPLTPVCAPGSTTTFAIGITTVNCTATDGSNNITTGSFTVTVRNPTQATQNLDTLATTAGMGSNNVDNVLKFLNHQSGGSLNAACNNLDSVIKKAQKKTPPATDVIAAAMNLQQTIGCTP